MSDKKTNKGWENLQGKKYSFANYDKAKHLELSRKGAEKSHQVARERRTAKQALEDILKLDCTPGIVEGAELPEELKAIIKAHATDISLYDLLMLVSVGLGVGGNVRALEFVRDSVGDAPTKSVSLEGVNIMTPEDREMIRHIEERLNRTDIMVVEDTTTHDRDMAAGRQEQKDIRSKEKWNE